MAARDRRTSRAGPRRRDHRPRQPHGHAWPPIRPCERPADPDPAADRAAAATGPALSIDEASLAGTLELHQLVSQAQTVGVTVPLVGDQHQLSAVQAGGTLSLLARRTQTAELTGLWRFTNRWEAQATRLLHLGDPAALRAYATHHRLHDGPREQVLDTAYHAWRTDSDDGCDTVLVSPPIRQPSPSSTPAATTAPCASVTTTTSATATPGLSPLLARMAL